MDDADSPREADPPGEPPGEAKKIRVVNAKRPLANVLLLAPEELRSILEALVLTAEPKSRQPLLALEQLAGDLRTLRDRGPTGRFPEDPGGRSSWAAPPPLHATAEMDEVVVRQLLYSGAVRPVVLWPPRPSSQAGAGGIRVRPGVRKPAFAASGGGVAIAAEQAVEVVGFAIDPEAQGDLVVDVFAGGVFVGVRALVDSGGFAPPTLSVALARADAAAAPQLTPAGAPLLPYSPGLAAALRRQLAAALEYHLGAGSVLALDRAAARAAARPGGLPEAYARVSTRGLEPAGGAEALAAERVRFLVGRLAEIYPTVTAAPDEFVFRLTPLLDFFRVGALGAYFALLTEGREAPAARRFLERAAVAEAEKARVAELGREVAAETARARHYAIIVEDTLGAGRAAALAAALAREGAGALDDPERVLGALSKRERELVATEYENRRLEWEAQVGNKCPHVGLAFRLRAATSAQRATALLRTLSGYFAPAAPSLRRARDPTPQKVKAADWILCKSCGFRVICPHVDELIRMEARNAPYETVRTNLLKYAVRYSDRAGEAVQTTYAYFCRICSERLAEFVEEDRTAERLGAVGTLDDYIKKVIWVEAVGAAETVRFPMPVDPRQFAATAVEVCHPLLLEAEGNLLKRGRRPARPARGDPLTADDPFGSEETIDPRTHLYVVLFVYAYVLNLIRSSNVAGVLQSRRLGFEGVRPGAKMGAYAEAILAAVLRKYSGLVAQVEDITPEFIADRFREAYRLVVGHEGPQELTAADDAKVIVGEVVELDPAYHYAAISARVFGTLPYARPATPAAARREFETVLGVSLPDILAARAADGQSELVQLLLGIRPGGRGARRVAAEYPRGSDPEFVYSDPQVNFYAAMFRAPPAALKKIDMGAFDGLAAFAARFPGCREVCVRETVVGGAVRKPKAAPFDPGAFLRGLPSFAAETPALYAQSYLLFTEYMTEITDKGRWEAFEGRLAVVRARERGYRLRLMAAALKNFRQFVFRASRRYGRRPAEGGGLLVHDVPITYLYDEDGVPHTWTGLRGVRGRASVYVYEAASREELTRGQIVERLAADFRAREDAGPLRGRRLVDVRCSICQTLMSESGKLSAKRAWASLRVLFRFTAFFSFFDARCPVEGLHDFPPAGACSKCGLEKSLIFDFDSPENAPAARAYYDRFLPRYRDQRDTVASAEGVLGEPKAAFAAADPAEEFRGFAEAWKYDFGLLVRAAELADVPVEALETLGATEGREYPDVLAKAGAPPPPAAVDDPRLLAADSDVRLFVTEYNRLRFVHRFAKPPAAALDILRELEVPLDVYAALPDELPDVYDSYRQKRLAVLRYRSPADVLLFTIETLARMALEVAGAGRKADRGAEKPPGLERLGREFAKRALRGIVRGERLLAKNGPFNFKIFGEDDVPAGGPGDLPADDFGDVGEDVLDAIEEAGGEEGAHNPFSLEGVDIDEDSPNLEPG